MAMLSLKVATEIWSPEHSSARMHRLLGPAVFVRRSLNPAVLISLSMVCGRNALACVRQSAQTPLVGWLVALLQVELDTTLPDVTRIPLNNAHYVSLANCKRQMTSSLPQCAGCRCLDRRPVSRTSLPNTDLRSVPGSMSAFSDFTAIFGRASLQNAFRYTHQPCQSKHRGDRRAHSLAALRLPARLRLTRHCPSRVACHGSEAMMEHAHYLSWLFQEVICILQCCC